MPIISPWHELARLRDALRRLENAPDLQSLSVLRRTLEAYVASFGHDQKLHALAVALSEQLFPSLDRLEAAIAANDQHEISRIVQRGLETVAAVSTIVPPDAVRLVS